MTSSSKNAPFLEAWRNPDSEARIVVDGWCAQEPITDQFIERSKSLRLVWNYFLRVGPVSVWRKIRSRFAEGQRNRKVAGVGTGRVLEAPARSQFETGQRVVFFAPNHSSNWPRICLDIRLIHPMEAAGGSATGREKLELPGSLRSYAGWSPYSGVTLDEHVVQAELKRLSSECRPAAIETREHQSAATIGRDRVEADVARRGAPSAVVFGLGNYAKTQIVPHVRHHLQLTAIHEIDQDQIASAAGLGATLDTSPYPRDAERYDAWFIAGFHHSHAALAVRALDDGAYAVVEKPLVTTREQFNALQHALARTRGRRLFTCFHKRYSRVNKWTRLDLGVDAGAPVDMHCMVYEIPLPALHWYNWPNSGSRLTSNGCHWLDYFLYQNEYSPVRELDVRPLRRSDLVTWVRLENGAQLTMSLTDTGSQRLGVRDVIDLRARDVTIRLIDSTYYDAENSSRVLRRRRVNPMDGYAAMYDTICRRIVAGQDGDSLESLRSTVLMLDLEDELGRKTPLDRRV